MFANAWQTQDIRAESDWGDPPTLLGHCRDGASGAQGKGLTQVTQQDGSRVSSREHSDADTELDQDSSKEKGTWLSPV